MLEEQRNETSRQAGIALAEFHRGRISFDGCIASSPRVVNFGNQQRRAGPIGALHLRFAGFFERPVEQLLVFLLFALEKQFNRFTVLGIKSVVFDLAHFLQRTFHRIDALGLLGEIEEHETNLKVRWIAIRHQAAQTLGLFVVLDLERRRASPLANC